MERQSDEQIERTNMSALDQWLAKQEAHCMWQQRIPRVGVLECWCLPRTRKTLSPMVLVQRWDNGGWDIYTQVSGTNDIGETFHAAEQHLGLRP